MKKFLIGLLFVVTGIHCSCGQSRGINYQYSILNSTNNFNVFTFNNGSPIFTDNMHPTTTFEMGFNDDVVVHTPYVKMGNNYFSLLTKFENYLCPSWTKKIPIPPSTILTAVPRNVAYTGTSKSDGGFALITNAYPHILRNYDAQGNLIFSKIISSTFFNGAFPVGLDTYPKLVANPDNNNLYLLFSTNENVGPYSGAYSSSPTDPTINVIEVSPTGSFINSFRITIPYATIYPIDYPYWSYPYMHHFYAIHDFITDVKYVKGGNGPASDRIWAALRIGYDGSEDVGNPIYIPGQAYASYFYPNYRLTGVAVFNPQGTVADVSVVLPTFFASNGGYIPSPQLAIAKNATPLLPAEVMLLATDDSKLNIYHFRDHTSVIPSNQYVFPYAVPVSNLIDLKNYQGNILFSSGSYFGVFDPSTLNINLRRQSTNNAQVLSFVDFITRDTNKLYINYFNYSNPSWNIYNPSNIIIKESMPSFNTTCKSDFVGNYTASTVAPSNFSLVSQLLPLPGVVLTKDLSYIEYKELDIVKSKDICLTCTGLNKSNDNDIEIINNLEIALHPNPAMDHFELTTELTVEKVEVYSMLGQLVKSFEQQSQYSISDLSKGSYIVKITTTEGTSNRTLIIE